MMGVGGAQGFAAGGGMGDVTARIAAIQSRIAGLTGPVVGQVPVIDAPTGNPAGAAAPPAFDLASATEVRSPLTAAPVSSSATAASRASGAATAAEPSFAASVNSAEPSSAAASLAAKLPPHGRQWAGAITDAALRVGLDPTLLAALVQHESNFKQSAVSHAGAIGLAQLMPGTARGLGVDPHDPLQNLAGGARFLREQLDRFGSVDLALAAYNAGPNRVAQAGGVPRIAETTRYVSLVTATWEKLR